MGDSLPDAWGAIDGADRDGDGQECQDRRERQRSKDVPGVPAIDDWSGDREYVRNRLRHGATAQRPDEDEDGQDGDLGDGGAYRAEKSPDAVDHHLGQRTWFRCGLMD